MHQSRYYLSQAVLRHGSGTCAVLRVPAAAIEEHVICQIRTMLRASEVVISTSKSIQPIHQEIGESEIRETLTSLDPLWSKLSPAEQARIVQLLIDRIEVGTGGLKIRFRDKGLAEMMTEVGTVATKTRRAAA